MSAIETHDTKSVILVGNSCKIIGLKLGKYIDKFDCVVRFNETVINGYKIDLGSKFDIHYINNPRLGFRHYRVKNKLLADCTFRQAGNILTSHAKLIQSQSNPYIPYEFLKKYYDKYNMNYHFSSGLSCILYFLFYLNYKFIYITNFNHYQRKKEEPAHYYDIFDKKNFKNADYDWLQKGGKHEWKKEENIVKQLILENKIKVLENSLD